MVTTKTTVFKENLLISSLIRCVVSHRSNCVAQRDLLTQDLYCTCWTAAAPMNLRTVEEENMGIVTMRRGSSVSRQAILGIFAYLDQRESISNLI